MNFLKNLFKKKKLGLCIGSGSARGFSSLPIIVELNKKGLDFDYITGCSIGSIIGSYYALNGEVQSLEKKLMDLGKTKWFSLLDLSNPKNSIIKGEKIKEFLKKEFFGDKTFKDCKIPISIVATDVHTKTATYFEDGLLIDAIMASICLPGIFKPYEIKGGFYIDGGISESLPVKKLFEKKMNNVIGIDFNSRAVSHKINLNSAFEVLLNTFHMLLETSKIPKKYKKNVYVFSPKFERNFAESLKFYKTTQNLDAGINEWKINEKKFNSWLRRRMIKTK